MEEIHDSININLSLKTEDMRKQNLLAVTILLASTFFYSSCQKENIQNQNDETIAVSTSQLNQRTAPPPFNLEVILRGAGKSFGLVKFRQDVDAEKKITLDTWFRDLAPNHAYLLQRAVDAANIVDGNCTSTSWLTLGKGPTGQTILPVTILTDEKGTGRQDFWRSVALISSGSMFDIHFRIVDAATMAVVLTSDCYAYTVR